MKKTVALPATILAAGLAASFSLSAQANPGPTPPPAPKPAPGHCLAKGVAKLPLNAKGVPAKASRTVHQILKDTRTCNRLALIRRTTADGTRLTFGNVAPRKFFALPQSKDRAYDNLLRALSARPAAEGSGKNVTYVWPRLAAGDNYKDRAAWQEAVRAGLITQKYADKAWRTDKMYYGWRVSIDTNGAWQSYVAGD